MAWGSGLRRPARGKNDEAPAAAGASFWRVEEGCRAAYARVFSSTSSRRQETEEPSAGGSGTGRLSTRSR